MTFTAPVLNYTLLSPILILLGGALLGVLVEAFVSKAIIEGIDVPRGAKVEEWNLTAELLIPNIH